MNIVFLDRGTIGPGVTIRPPGFKHTWIDHHQTAPQETVSRLADADIAITNKVSIGEAELAQLPNLKFIAVAATGTNVIDIDACRKRNILVSNIQGYAKTTVPEHTFAMILALRRNLFQYRQEVIDGKWQASGQFCYFNRPIRDLAGSTLGIVGTGAIAQSVAQIGKAFNMKVIMHSLSGRKRVEGISLASMDELITTSDVISLHCPLTEKSEGLFSAETFAKMKVDAILVNTARGQIVDLHALEKALKNNQIGGAAIDVAPVEPPPMDSPLMKMSALPNFLLTPHRQDASLRS